MVSPLPQDSLYRLPVSTEHAAQQRKHLHREITRVSDASLLIAENQTIVAANTVRYSYRRFGNSRDGNVPLVFYSTSAVTWTIGIRR